MVYNKNLTVELTQFGLQLYSANNVHYLISLSYPGSSLCWMVNIWMHNRFTNHVNNSLILLIYRQYTHELQNIRQFSDKQEVKFQITTVTTSYNYNVLKHYLYVYYKLLHICNQQKCVTIKTQYSNFYTPCAAPYSKMIRNNPRTQTEGYMKIT